MATLKFTQLAGIAESGTDPVLAYTGGSSSSWDTQNGLLNLSLADGEDGQFSFRITTLVAGGLRCGVTTKATPPLFADMNFGLSIVPGSTIKKITSGVEAESLKPEASAVTNSVVRFARVGTTLSAYWLQDINVEYQMATWTVPSGPLQFFVDLRGACVIDSLAGVNLPGQNTWTALGGENVSVTVPANTFVRYGSPYKYAYATKSGTFVINNASFGGGDPSPGNAKSASAYTAPAPATPVFTSAPVLNGTPTARSEVSFTSGVVTGAKPITLTQQFTLDGVDIAGAVNATYIPVDSDTGKALRVRQIATNSAGSMTSNSNPVTIAAAPVDTTKPQFVSVETSRDGASVIITMNEALGSVTPSASAFTLAGKTIGSVARAGATITLGSLTPAFSAGEQISLSYTVPASNRLQDTSGNEADAFGPVTVVNKTFPSDNANTHYVIYGAGFDITTPTALISYIRGLDCVALGKKVVIFINEDITFFDAYPAPLTHNQSCYVEMTPSPGKGANVGATDSSSKGYGSTGILITLNGQRFCPGSGMDIHDFRIRGTVTSQESISFNNGQSTGRNLSFRNNQVWLTSSATHLTSSEYGSLCNCYNNFFLFDGTSTSAAWSGGIVDIQRNTFVRKGAGAGTAPLLIGYNIFKDNLLLGFGPNPLSTIANFTDCSNNFADIAQTTVTSSITTAALSAMVISIDNVLPIAGSPLLGAASANAVSTNDARGGNRGTSPDVGAYQRTAATPLVAASITNQAAPDGQTIVISGTTTNSPTSASLSLSPASLGNGAQSMGPLAITLGSGTFTISVDDVLPGSYLAPILLFTNAGGTTMAANAHAFEIMGVDGAAQDVTSMSAATAITWSPQTSGFAGTASQPVIVGANGTLTGTVRVTPTPVAGVTFTPAYVDLTSGTTGSFTITRAAAGSSTIALTNNVGLANPSAITYVAAAVVSPPTVSLSTSPSTVTVSGLIVLTASVSSDVTKVEFYRGSTLVGTDIDTPFTGSVSVTSSDNGTLSFTAKAFGPGGTTTSAAASVLVNIAVTVPAPTVTLAASSTTVVADGNVVLTATASSNVTEVKFYRGMQLIGTDTAAPFSFTLPLDFSDNGTIFFTAQATNAGGSTTSSPITVSVNIPAPVEPGTGAVLAGTILLPNPALIGQTPNFVISSAPPDDDDGQPDGTIYFQTV